MKRVLVIGRAHGHSIALPFPCRGTIYRARPHRDDVFAFRYVHHLCRSAHQPRFFTPIRPPQSLPSDKRPRLRHRRKKDRHPLDQRVATDPAILSSRVADPRRNHDYFFELPNFLGRQGTHSSVRS